MAKAQASLRPLLPTQAADISVLFREGLYSFQLNDTVVFTAQDGGTNEFTVTYASAPGERAVFEGGIPLSDWSLHDATHNIWEAALPASLSVPREVYIGHDRMNETNLGNATTYGFKILSAADTEITPTGYLTNNSHLVAAALAQQAVCEAAGVPAGSAACAADVEFLYRMVGCQWVEDRIRVSSWNVLPGGWLNVTFPSAGWFLQRHKTYRNDYPSHVVNLHVTLTADSTAGWGGVPGTGYVSGANRRVFYVPRPGVDNMSVLDAWVPVLDGPFVRVEGQRGSAPVSNIVFSGLTFRHATWSYPTGPCGYAPDQSGIIFDCGDITNGSLPYHASHAVPGALELHAARNMTIEGCVFEHLGATGVTVEDGSQDVLITDSAFLDMGCHAVRFAQVDDWNNTDPNTQNARMTLRNSVVRGTGAGLRDCSAVMGGYLLNSTIANNNVTDAQWAGITVGWGWGDPPRPTLGGNAITGNFVSRVNLATADGGPIYVLGGQAHQSEFTGNFVSRALHHAALLYHDEGSCRWHTHDNVADTLPEDIATPNGGWVWIALSAWAGSEHDIRMERITTRFLNVTHIYPGNNLTLTNLTVLPLGAQWTPDAQAVIDAAGARFDWATLGVGKLRDT